MTIHVRGTVTGLLELSPGTCTLGTWEQHCYCTDTTLHGHTHTHTHTHTHIHHVYKYTHTHTHLSTLALGTLVLLVLDTLALDKCPQQFFCTMARRARAQARAHTHTGTLMHRAPKTQVKLWPSNSASASCNTTLKPSAWCTGVESSGLSTVRLPSRLASFLSAPVCTAHHVHSLEARRSRSSRQ